MSFWQGFAQGFKDTQDKKFQKEQTEAEREFQESLLLRKRQWQLDDTAANRRHDMQMEVFKRFGTAGRGSRGGKAPDTSNEAVVGAFTKLFDPSQAETPEDAELLKRQIAAATADPSIAVKVMGQIEDIRKEHGQKTGTPLVLDTNAILGIASDLDLSPGIAVEGIRNLTPEQIENMTMPEMEEMLSQSGPSGSNAYIPTLQVPIAESLNSDQQADVISNLVIALANEDLSKMEDDPASFGELQSMIDLYNKDEGLSETLKLNQRYAPQLKEYIENNPRAFTSWRTFNPTLDFAIREIEEQEIPAGGDVPTPPPTPRPTGGKAPPKQGDVIKTHKGDYKFVGDDPNNPEHYVRVD